MILPHITSYPLETTAVFQKILFDIDYAKIGHHSQYKALII